MQINLSVIYTQHIFDIWGDQKLFYETFGEAAGEASAK